MHGPRAMKLHLVDGTYELFRAFYAPGPSRHTPDGIDVKATRGFVMTMGALLRQDDVTHVAVAFDTVIESFRNDLFSGYKSGDGIEPDLWRQFPLAEQAAEALGLVVWRMHEFETDDALCTAAARWTDNVDQIVICSPDKDFAQCVRGDAVVLFDRRRDMIYNEAGVHEKWGVSPASIPDWLALVGDSADGIPGIARWGSKSAAAVLSHYGHLENIPEHCEQWSIKVRGGKTLAENLAAQQENALLYRRLATLRNDVPLTEELPELRWRGFDAGKLQRFCSHLGDQSLYDRLAGILKRTM